MNSMKIDEEIFNKVSLLGENKINRLNQILTKLQSPLKTAASAGNSACSNGDFPTLQQGIQSILKEAEIKMDTDGPLLAPPKSEPGAGRGIKLENKMDLSKRNFPKALQKTAEIHKKLLKTKPPNSTSKLIETNEKTVPVIRSITKTSEGKKLNLIGLKCKFFKCNKCDETFTSIDLRNDHMENNHFDCKVCTASFISSVAFEVHSRFGHGPFKCEICPEIFTEFAIREKHRSEVHGGIQLFLCRECGGRFTTHEAAVCHQVVFPRCKTSRRARKTKTLREARDQSKLLKIVERNRVIYPPPSNEMIIVV